MAVQGKEYPVTIQEDLPIKLDAKNYLSWSEQVQAVITAHNLERFVVNPRIPNKYASESDRLKDIASKEYKQWFVQDQMLMTWLKLSISEGIFPLVLQCNYSWQVWDTVHEHMGSHLKVLVGHFRSKLNNTKKKGTQSMSEYFASVKDIVDSLAEMGESVSQQEHIEAILKGLPEEYDSAVKVIRARNDDPPIIFVESFLLVKEAQIEKPGIPDDGRVRNE